MLNFAIWRHLLVRQIVDNKIKWFEYKTLRL